MRIGNNPHKDKNSLVSKYSHRVIVPVHIPSNIGYHENSLEVLKICLNSLFKTTNSLTAITIVSNNSNYEVTNYLNELFIKNEIQEVIHTGKVGKLNSILKAIRSCDESIVTITDADVLFLDGWLENTIEIFNNFPKVGVVGIVPQFKMYENLGYNVIFDNLCSKKIRFSKVKNAKALQLFYKSIGWDESYNKAYLKQQLTLESDECKAVVGSGHFVATYNKSLFDNNLPFSDMLLGGGSEHKYLDVPATTRNLWRLSTEDNFAYHMGNTIETWMYEELNKLKNTTYQIKLKPLKKASVNKPLSFFKNVIFKKIIHDTFLWKIFLKRKGLDEKFVNDY
jgi:hypothetical protein